MTPSQIAVALVTALSDPDSLRGVKAALTIVQEVTADQARLTLLETAAVAVDYLHLFAMASQADPEDVLKMLALRAQGFEVPQEHDDDHG